MITKILALDAAPKPADAADALALAVCHLWRAPMTSRLAEAETKAAELARRHRARLKSAAKAAAPKPSPRSGGRS
jgi:crossover junction endodeoxyribonuclease RuvC